MDTQRSFTRIKGLSERRRLPRLGKIRLGVKMQGRNGNEYPKEVDYFVCPPEVEAVYGKTPRVLDVMLPVNDPEVVFPQKLAWYGRSRGPKCVGDGERAMRVDEQTGEFYERDCPCEKLERGGECGRRAHLLVMLPNVSIGGVYQIDLGSFHSIVDLNSGMDYVQALVGRIAMLPLKLRRVARETHGSGKKEIHYTLQLILEGDIRALNSWRSETLLIPETTAPYLIEAEDVNPALDPGARVVQEQPEPPATEPPPPEAPAAGPDTANWKKTVNLLSKAKISLKKMELYAGKKKTEWGLPEILLVEAAVDRILGGADIDQLIIDRTKSAAAVNTQADAPAEPPQTVGGEPGELAWLTCPDAQERPETYCPECPLDLECERRGPICQE